MAQKPTFTALQEPAIDPKTGRWNWTWLKLIQQWMQQLAGGFDSNGNLVSNLEPTVGIVGRSADIGTILGEIDDTGVVKPAGLPAASPTQQGAVKLAAGSIGNTLGSASMQPSTAFDASGAAAGAQTAAEAHADAVAATAQSNAEMFATNAINTAFAPGISVTITTAALTGTGAQGSMTFTNGLLTAQTQAT
jgi:hypothetical protein